MFERFTEPGIKVVVTAQEEARKIGNNFVGTEQILIGLIAETSGIGGRVLRKYGITLRLAREEIKRLVGRGSGFVAVEIPFTPRARRVLENAIEESKTLGFPYVGPEHILLGILMEESGIAITALRKILKEVNPGVTFDNIRRKTLDEMGEDFEQEFGSRRKDSSENNSGKDNKQQLKPARQVNTNDESSGEFNPADLHPYFDPGAPLLLSPAINEYTTNITQMAFAGNIDPVVGRDTEVQRVLQILSRRRKNNPILLGEPGVGKTAVAEGLALQIIAGFVPATLKGKNIIALDLGLIIAGSRYRGDFEKRLKRVISDIQLTKCYILVVDEVHTLVGAGAAEGSLDAANILKPALARGEFQCIGATTLAEYRKYIEPDAALARRFQSVMVKEPSVDDTVTILAGIQDKYEAHHGVRITRTALEEAALLSSRYINDRYLPDKAIDIIDEACSRVRLGFELIPDVCNDFEDHLTSIVREKESAYNDRDWFEGLDMLREEIKFVQLFLSFLYDLINKLREEKKVWVIRALQQRYQFIFKGVGPLLKEWDLVVKIYDNEELILKTEKRSKNDNSSDVSQVNEKNSLELQEDLPEPQDQSVLERDLLYYREGLKDRMPKSYLNFPPRDKNNKPMEYDESRQSTKSEFDEVNPFLDQELSNIQKEIDNMEDLDRLDELQQKFDSRQSIFVNSEDTTKVEDIADFVSETITSDKDLLNTDIDSIEIDKTVNVQQVGEESSEQEFISKNVASRSLVRSVNSSASATTFRDILTKYKIPFDKRVIPNKVAEAVQKKLFTDLFTPFTPLVDHASDLNNFVAEDEKLNEIVGIDLESTVKIDFKDLDKFLMQQKLWCLFSFIIWNRVLLRQNFNSDMPKEIPRFSLEEPVIDDAESNEAPLSITSQYKPSENLSLSIGWNQVGLEVFNLYKKQNLLIRLDNVDLTAALSWRDVFHESLLERIGNKLVERFGYSYGASNVNLLPSDVSESSNNVKNEKLYEKPELSPAAKEFISNNPDWLTMSPKDLKEAISKEDDSSSDVFLPEERPQKNITVSITDKKDNSENVSDENKRVLAEMSNTIVRNNQEYQNYIPWVFASDIAGVISEWTGIPVQKVSKNEKTKLLNIEQELKKQVIGQPEAVEAIAKALRRSRVGLRDLSRPIASFFFSGPTGVGKTEVTKALAASYFGGESEMIRFDMSEFMERHTVSKLIGAPPGYVGYNEGGQLTEAVRRKPYVVILFDEVEKAHPDVFNLLLQVLEDGRLSDSQGRIVDFKNTIIVMTSNLGAAAIQDPSKFSNSNVSSKGNSKITGNLDDDLTVTEDDLNDYDANEGEGQRIKDLVLNELKSFFRPEFLNRIDEIVVFRKLTKIDIKEIAAIMLSSLKTRLLSKSYHLLLSDAVIDQIIDEGFDPEYGARPLRRVIMTRIEDNLASTILEEEIEPGSAIWIDYQNNEYTVNHKNFDAAENLAEFYKNEATEDNKVKPEDRGLM